MIVTTSAVDDKRYILLSVTSRNEFHEGTETTKRGNVWSETNFQEFVLWIGPVDWTKLLRASKEWRFLQQTMVIDTDKKRIPIYRFERRWYRANWHWEDTWMSVKAPSQPLNSLSEKQWSVYKSNRLYKRRE